MTIHHAEPLNAARVVVMSIRFEVHALSSCQIAVDYDVLCPYGVHAHVENEVLRTRRRLDFLASRRCSVNIHHAEPSHSVCDDVMLMQLPCALVHWRGSNRCSTTFSTTSYLLLRGAGTTCRCKLQSALCRETSYDLYQRCCAL